MGAATVLADFDGAAAAQVVYGCWANDSSVVEWMAANGYAAGDYDAVLGYFVKKAQAIGRASGFGRPTQWEEVFKAGLADTISPDTIFQVTSFFFERERKGGKGTGGQGVGGGRVGFGRGEEDVRSVCNGPALRTAADHFRPGCSTLHDGAVGVDRSRVCVAVHCRQLQRRGLALGILVHSCPGER